MENIKDIRDWLQEKKGEQTLLLKDIGTLTSEVKIAGKLQRQHEKALEIVKLVGLETQKQLQFHISNITSLAMESVLDNPYKLDVSFVERRDKTECDLTFTRDGMEEKLNPLNATGGGVVDIASFALRIASWSLENPRSNNVMLLDEPMRFLSKDNQEKASLMLKELSKKLNLQFIIITHEENLTIHADKIFTTSIKNGVTKVN